METTSPRKIRVYRLLRDTESTALLGEPLVWSPDNRKLFHRIVSWFVCKLGGKYAGLGSYARSEEIDIEEVINAIVAQKEIVGLIVQRRPKYLLIGREQIQKLKLRMDYGAFTIPAQIGNTSTAINKTFAGLEIRLIPWMSGIIVVPDLQEREPHPTTDSLYGVLPPLADTPTI